MDRIRVIILIIGLLISSCYYNPPNKTLKKDDEIKYVLDLNTSELRICWDDDDIILCF